MSPPDWWRRLFCDPCWRGDHAACQGATLTCECACPWLLGAED